MPPMERVEREVAPDFNEDTLLEPLTPAVFYILLALMRGPLHGYGIRQQAHKDSGGAVQLADGTVYPALRRLMAQGLIARAEAHSDNIEYELTPNGEAHIYSEIVRLESAISSFKHRLGPQTRSREIPEYLPLAY